MKRVKAACITQTLHFQLKDDVEKSFGIRQVKMGVDKYKRQIDGRILK